MDSSGTTGTTTYGSTIIQGIIIFVLLIGLIFLIYYLVTRPSQVPYPISPFNDGDTIQIVPAVLSQYAGINPSPDQYLIRNNCSSSNSSGHCVSADCYQNQNPFSGVNSCALTFTGNVSDPKTRWILRDLPSAQTEKDNSNVSLTSGFGNRFYLQSATTVLQTDSSARVTFNIFNNDGNACGSCGGAGDRSFPYCSTNDNTCDCFNQEMIIYMKPTSIPNLYYILFPSKRGLSNFCPVSVETPLNYWPNDAICTLRPYSQYTNNTPTYFPWDSAGNLLNNGPLLNTLPGTCTFPSGPFANPEITLFKITKA